MDKGGDTRTRDRLNIILSMLIFGTVGLVRRSIPYSSAMIAFVRGAVATVILLLVHALRRRPFDRANLMANMAKLIVSGAMIGFNWILLFEAYRFTSVSVATVCYYMAPIFTILLSPLALKERITVKKGLCVAIAFLGMVFVSGVIQDGISGLKGVLLALGAAVLYACVVIINKKMHNVSGIDRTIFQMGPAALAVLPYWLLTDDLAAIQFDWTAVLMLAVAGIVNTALAYELYFKSIERVPAQSAALFSYIDPIVAILLSAVVLKESMGALSAVGVVLVIGAAMVSELEFRRPSGGVGAR